MVAGLGVPIFRVFTVILLQKLMVTIFSFNIHTAAGLHSAVGRAPDS